MGAVQWDPSCNYLVFSFTFFFFFFLKIASFSCPFPPPHSGFGAKREQLNKGAEEGVQPALVGHALLNHFLLTRVLSCLLNGVGLEKRTISVSKENRNENNKLMK